MYMGMSPFQAPGAYTLLPYAEFIGGIHYPIGGMHALPKSLEKIAKTHGATFLYNKTVTNINTSPITNLATGVTLLDGTRLSADIVVCNADLVTAYNQLLPPSPYAKYLASLNQTCSTFSFYWGLDRKVSGMQAHNIFLADDYKDSFDDIFIKHSLPAIPSFYIHVPSKIDPTCSPDGCETLTVLVPVGTLLAGFNQSEWKALLGRARRAVIEIIEMRVEGMVGFEKSIVAERVNTPVDWKDKFGLWNGSALGLSHELLQVIYMRPATRHREFGNLFFVGASTHPGTGVPIVLCSAKLVANQIQGIIASGNGFKHPSLANTLISVLVCAANNGAFASPMIVNRSPLTPCAQYVNATTPVEPLFNVTSIHNCITQCQDSFKQNGISASLDFVAFFMATLDPTLPDVPSCGCFPATEVVGFAQISADELKKTRSCVACDSEFHVRHAMCGVKLGDEGYPSHFGLYHASTG
ncbi:hypothetical protein HDU76_008482, partial [Blyttiomyces sp. JEL0837]